MSFASGPKTRLYSPVLATSAMPRPIQARIDLSALLHNSDVVRRQAPGAKIWAVVKADAYGHGLRRVAKAVAAKVDGFAVLDLAAAISLRDAGIRQPVLLLEGCFEVADLEVCAEYNLTPAVHHLDQLRMLAAADLKVKLPIYLKLNSGMNRLGFTAAQLSALRAALEASDRIASVSLMTHFANADDALGVEWQLARFAEMRNGWLDSMASEVSMANSAAILHHPKTAADWVRPGIMLYGSSPFADQSAFECGLRPVMTLTSRIIAVQDLGVGERVGYGGLFTAERPTRVGIVACGYADGYPRHALGGTPILVCGKRTVTVGRVSMDMLTCDLTDIPEADVGSQVVLWGDGLPADEVAASAGTLAYELFCALAQRVSVIEA